MISCIVIPGHFKSMGYYVIPSIRKIAFKRLYVRPSIHQRIVFTLLGAFYNQFSSNLLLELILGRSVLGLQMGKFWQISTELWPLIGVGNWFSLSIFDIPLPIFFKLDMRVDISKECPRIADR